LLPDLLICGAAAAHTLGGMSLDGPSPGAAVSGLVRTDPHGPGITRARIPGGFRYLDPSAAEITDRETLDRIRALRIPPAWENVWISTDPLGHIQATGVDSRDRLQYIYHRLWREQRDAQKFAHMIRFAGALPALRTAAQQDLRRRGLTHDRVLAGVVRLIDLGLFRVGGERYAELDHHYGITTLEKRHVRLTRNGILFDYIAKAGKQRTIEVTDPVVQPTVRTLARTDNGHDALFCYEEGGAWHQLHSREVGNYIAAQSGGHFTAKEFRTWNATVLMALVLANAGPSATQQSRKRVISASVREVARALGDTPAVARSSYIDPRLVTHYESEGELAGIPAQPAGIPASAETEAAIAAFLTSCGDGVLPAADLRAGEIHELIAADGGRA
jgi:DNA topoisomerase I